MFTDKKRKPWIPVLNVRVEKKKGIKSIEIRSKAIAALK